MMNIVRTYQTVSLEAEFGGYDLREFTLMANPHDNGFGVKETNDLTLVTSVDGKEFYTVFYSINGHDTFTPLHGMDRELWKVIWRKFRTLNRQL